MFISHGVWLLRTRDLRRRAKTFGMTFDEFPEAREWQAGGLKLDLGIRRRRVTDWLGVTKPASSESRDSAAPEIVQIQIDTAVVV